jgi:hypothetical protein
MPDFHKTLILANLRWDDGEWKVDELAVATEHAPFRHRKLSATPGAQRKKQRQSGSATAREESAEETRNEQQVEHDGNSEEHIEVNSG